MAILLPLLNSFGAHLGLLFVIFVTSYLWVLKPWEEEPLEDKSKEINFEEKSDRETINDG